MSRQASPWAPQAAQHRFDIVAGMANLGGLGAGPLVAGALAQWAPAPLRTPYLVFLVLLPLVLAMTFLLGQTLPYPL